MSMKRTCLWMLAGILACAAAQAANGDLDAGFGNGGFALGGISDADVLLPPPKPVVQADGKIVVCTILADNGSSGSDFLVARFNANGTLDTSFSFDGKVAIDFDAGLGGDDCRGVAVQQDGKIVAMGSTGSAVGNYDFAVVRLMPDGDLDTSFGAGTGKTLVPFDLGGTNSDVATAMAIQADGKLVLAGYSATGANGDDFAIVRLLGDGTRDTTFNLTGRVTVGFNFAASTSKDDQAYAVSVDAAGRIVVAGSVTRDSASNVDFAVARLLSNGQLDSNFDADGRATLAFDLGLDGYDQNQTMILQRDGRIVLGGYVNTSASATTNVDMAVARLLPDGSPDPGFGIGGKVLVPFDLAASAPDALFGIVEQGNGYLVLGGIAAYDASFNYRAAVARLRPNGNLDDQFGALGKKTYNFAQGAPDYQLFLGVALQGSQIIASGVIQVGATNGDLDLLVARLENDLIFADRFE